MHFQASFSVLGCFAVVAEVVGGCRWGVGKSLDLVVGKVERGGVPEGSQQMVK